MSDPDLEERREEIRREIPPTIVRDFAYERMSSKSAPRPKLQQPQETKLLDLSRPHPHPLRSNPDPRSKYSHFPYKDWSVTLTTPTGERITWVPRGQLVPPGIESTPLRLRGLKKKNRKRDVVLSRLKVFFFPEKKEKMKVHVVGRKPSSGLLGRMREVFREKKKGTRRKRRERKKEEDCRLCRADGMRYNHENHRISPTSSEFSNGNGRALNPLAGKTSQYEIFVHEKAEALIASSFVGLPPLESAAEVRLPSMENWDGEHRPAPGPSADGVDTLTRVPAEFDAINKDGKYSTTGLTESSKFAGQKTSNQRIGGLDGTAEYEDSRVNIESQVVSKDDSMNITFTHFDSNHKSSTSTSATSELSHLLSQFPSPQDYRYLNEMNNISNLELPKPKYPEAYAGLAEGEKDALYAKDWPLPPSRASSCDSIGVFHFASRATIKDALQRWSTAAKRSSVCSDEEPELKDKVIEKGAPKELTTLMLTPVKELEQRLQEAMESPLLGTAIPRPNSAEIDKRRKEMNLRLRRVSFAKSLSETSDFTSEPSLSIMIGKIDVKELKPKQQEIIFGSPFVDVHEEYVAHPSTSFPKSPAPIGYPALDSSATLSEFGFHPTIDTMPASWKQQWEMLDSYHSFEDREEQVATESMSDATSTSAEEPNSLIVDDVITHSDPIPIKRGKFSARMGSVQQSASQLMFSRCRKIPGAFVNDKSPNTSEHEVVTF